MMQRTSSLAFHSQQSLSFGTPTQQLPSEQEQPVIPYVQENHPSFVGGNQPHAQSWINDPASVLGQLQEPRRQAYSPPRAAPQSYAPSVAPSTSFLQFATPRATATNGKRMESGYDGVATGPMFGRASTILSEKETDVQMGSILHSQRQQQQTQTQHYRPQHQQQQKDLEPQHKDAVSQGMSSAIQHSSIPSYLRPYISNKPIVSITNNISRGDFDQSSGQAENYSSLTSGLFSQSQEIKTLLDKITMLDGTLDGFDRQMVDYQKRMTDVMVTKKDALSMFESKAGEKVVETLQRQGAEVLVRLKEQAEKAQELQGRHLEEWRRNLIDEVRKMTTLWQEQIGKLQEIQVEWKGELWRWKTQVQEDLASEMNALRSAIALQSNMLSMISEVGNHSMQSLGTNVVGQCLN